MLTADLILQELASMAPDLGPTVPGVGPLISIQERDHTIYAARQGYSSEVQIDFYRMLSSGRWYLMDEGHA